MVSVMSDATMVGTSAVLVKLFFLEKKQIGVYLLEISIRFRGLITCNGTLLRHWAKQ